MSVESVEDQPRELDVRHPDNVANPFPLYRWLRRNEPVHRSASLDSWVITRHDDVLAILQDQERFSSDRFRKVTTERRAVRSVAGILGLWMGLCDPPDHTRRRRPWHNAFTSRRLEGARERIQGVVDDLLDRVADQGRMEFIEDFAFPLPAYVIASMMGVPKKDTDLIKDWSDKIAAYMGGAQTDRDNMELAEEGVLPMADYFRELVTRKRPERPDDLIGMMLAAEEGDERLSEDEIVANCVLLVFAGHETTTHLLGNGLFHLLRNPDQHKQLAADPSAERCTAAVEEFLRYDGAVPAVLRVATQDVELRGQRIASGDIVLPVLSSANRDPEVYDDPDRLDIARGAGHMAFGHGVHFCLGGHLARLEARVAFERLFARFDGIELLDENPPWLPQLFLRGLKELPIAWR